MSTLVHFVGKHNGKRFSVSAEKKSVQTLLGCVLDGEDEFFDNAINKDTLVGKCIDAMSWEAEDFIQKMIIAMDIHGRFAIHHNETVFGVATDEVNAMAAFKNEEF